MVSMYKKVVGVVVFYFQASKRWNGIRVLDDINASSKTFWLPRVHQPKNLWGGITKYTDIINTVPDLSAQTTFCKAQRKRSIKRLYRECHESEFLPTHFRGFLDRIWAWKEQHYSKWRNMHSLNAIQKHVINDQVTALNTLGWKRSLTKFCDDISLVSPYATIKW